MGPDPDKVASLEKATSERETVVTRARSSRYTVVYLRYRTATSEYLQESMALIDPSQDMRAIFRFVIDASRPPTAGPLGRGDSGPNRIDPAQERRRKQVRHMALQRFEEYRSTQGRARSRSYESAGLQQLHPCGDPTRLGGQIPSDI
jgi:hypothetical protein